MACVKQQMQVNGNNINIGGDQTFSINGQGQIVDKDGNVLQNNPMINVNGNNIPLVGGQSNRNNFTVINPTHDQAPEIVTKDDVKIEEGT